MRCVTTWCVLARARKFHAQVVSVTGMTMVFWNGVSTGSISDCCTTVKFFALERTSESYLRWRGRGGVRWVNCCDMMIVA